MADTRVRDGTVFLLVVAGVLGGYYFLRPGLQPAPTRERVMIPQDALPGPGDPGLAISPDGVLLTYSRAGDAGGVFVWDVSTDELLALNAGGAPGAPAFAPDGGSIAYVDGDAGLVSYIRLGETALSQPGPLARNEPVRFSPDGAWVYFTNLDGGISRTPSERAEPEVVTHPGAGEEHRVGDVAGDGATLVYEMAREGDVSRLVSHSLSDGTSVDLGRGSSPRIAGASLLFVDPESGELRATSFAASEGGRIRESTAVLERVADLQAPYGVSQDGLIVAARASGAPSVTPVWVTPDGEESDVYPGWSFRGHRTYTSFALSQSESRIVWSMPSQEGTWELHVADIDDPLRSVERVTVEGGFNYRPHWVGTDELVFVSDRAGQADGWRLDLETRTAARVVDGTGPIRNATLTPDGAWLVFREGEAPVADLFAQSSTGGPTLPVANREAGERAPRVSPDGRWIAYSARLDDGWEVFVTPAPPAQGRARAVQVSVLGGEEPLWSRDGRSLFYRSPDLQMMRVAVPEESGGEWGLAETLFDTNQMLGSDGRAQFDVAADGRFLMLRDDGPLEVEIVRIENALPVR